MWETPRQLKAGAAKPGLQESWAGDEEQGLVEIPRPACAGGPTSPQDPQGTAGTAGRSQGTPASAVMQNLPVAYFLALKENVQIPGIWSDLLKSFLFQVRIGSKAWDRILWMNVGDLR